MFKKILKTTALITSFIYLYAYSNTRIMESELDWSPSLWARIWYYYGHNIIALGLIAFFIWRLRRTHVKLSWSIALVSISLIGMWKSDTIIESINAVINALLMIIVAPLAVIAAFMGDGDSTYTHIDNKTITIHMMIATMITNVNDKSQIETLESTQELPIFTRHAELTAQLKTPRNQPTTGKLNHAVNI